MNLYDLPSKKLSLQKIFGLNLTLSARDARGIAHSHFAALRAARAMGDEIPLTLILEGIYDSARTYFSNNL